MSKNVIIIVGLGVVLVGGFAWQTALKNMADLRGANSQLQAQAQKQQQEIETLRQKLKADEAQLAARQATSQVTMSSLQQQLAMAQAHVLELLGKVSQARTERERLEHVLQTTGEAQLNDQIHHDQVELKDLDDQERSTKLNEKNLKGEQNQALAQQRQAHGAALADVKNQITALKQSISLTQQQLKDWRSRKGDVDQRDQLANLNQQLATQRGQMATLQNQIGQIKQDESIQVQSLKLTGGGEHALDQSQQGRIADQRRILKADLQALTNKKSTSDRDQASLKSQVQRARDQEKAASDQVLEAQKMVTTLRIQVSNEQEAAGQKTGQTSGQMPQ